jgi:hypothetical protein
MIRNTRAPVTKIKSVGMETPHCILRWPSQAPIRRACDAKRWNSARSIFGLADRGNNRACSRWRWWWWRRRVRWKCRRQLRQRNGVGPIGNIGLLIDYRQQSGRDKYPIDVRVDRSQRAALRLRRRHRRRFDSRQQFAKRPLVEQQSDFRHKSDGQSFGRHIRERDPIVRLLIPRTDGTFRARTTLACCCESPRSRQSDR